MPAVKQKKPVSRPKVGAANRKQAPKISVIEEYYQDDSAIVLGKAKAALGETKASGMSFMYGTANPVNAEKLSLQGWVPVVTEDGKGNTTNWQHGVDPLLMRPKGKSEKGHNASAAVARDQLRNTIAAKGESDLAAE